MKKCDIALVSWFRKLVSFRSKNGQRVSSLRSIPFLSSTQTGKDG